VATTGIGRIGVAAALAIGLAMALAAAPARPQDPAMTTDPSATVDDPALDGELGDEEETAQTEAAKKLKSLTGAAKKEKEKVKPPFEFFRTQVAPFDTLPYVKENHWNTVNQELRANLADYEGTYRSSPIRLRDQAQAVVFRREARLVKGQSTRLGFQVMLPQVRQLGLELIREGAIRPDDGTLAPMLPLGIHQMIIPILAVDPDQYIKWARYQAMQPASGDKDPNTVEKRRYYRLVTLQIPEKPLLSPHPLTWTTTSHLLWDELDPGSLSPGQQQALVDWLHWGGQLIIVGGASRTLALMSDQESFLSPYLPAEPSGESHNLDAAALRPLSDAYPPPAWPDGYEGPETQPEGVSYTDRPTRYKKPVPILPASHQPIYLAGLRPRTDDAVALPLGDGSGRALGYERRVGRGRILMLGFTPTDPALATWPGLDTFVRRFLLRRREDPWTPGQPGDNSMLGGPDLTWVRYAGRDLGVGQGRAPGDGRSNYRPDGPSEPGKIELPTTPVAAWLDDATLPASARDSLRKASGISIPGSDFVLKVVLAYVIALVPLNYLFSRFILRRRELAWVIAPILALGFAVAVERAAAIDLGYESACDEVDLLEVQPGYRRAHLSRFAALYSTGRVRYTIAYPQDPTALALPLATAPNQRGEEVSESAWQSSPVPSLVGLQVQPRSLSMFRAEQMADLGGTIDLESPADGPRRVVNRTDLELRDAVLIDPGAGPDDPGRSRPLGTIGPGATVELPARDAADPDPPAPASPPRSVDDGWLEPEPFLAPLREYDWGGPEDKGELRLVAWARRPQPGQEIEPPVDRHRGFTLVLAHLRYGPPPPPEGPMYDLAHAPPAPAPAPTEPEPVLPVSVTLPGPPTPRR